MERQRIGHLAELLWDGQLCRNVTPQVYPVTGVEVHQGTEREYYTVELGDVPPLLVTLDGHWVQDQTVFYLGGDARGVAECSFDEIKDYLQSAPLFLHLWGYRHSSRGTSVKAKFSPRSGC